MSAAAMPFQGQATTFSPSGASQGHPASHTNGSGASQASPHHSPHQFMQQQQQSPSPQTTPAPSPASATLPMPPNSSPHAYTQHSWGYNMAQPHLQMQSHPQQAAASPMIANTGWHQYQQPTSHFNAHVNAGQMPTQWNSYHGIAHAGMWPQQMQPQPAIHHQSLSTANTFNGHSMPGFLPQTSAAGAYAHTNVPIYGIHQGAHAQSASGRTSIHSTAASACFQPAANLL